MQRLNGADAIVSAGRDQSGRLSQIKLVAAEYDRLNGQIDKLARSIATQEAGLNSSASSLQKVSSTANAVEAAVSAARREIELQTKALRDQAAVAQTAANVQRVTGTGRTTATDNGAGFEALARREIQLQELRAAAARDAAAAVAESVRRATGIGNGRATDNGASFQALAAREEAAALREAAVAHQMFEARVKQGAAAMADAAAEERAMADAAARLRAQLDPVAAIEARLSAEQAKLNNLFKQGKISAEELSAGLKLLDGDAKRALKAFGQSGSRPALFGLQPHELTNLSYQVNDVVTQLASGTSLAQTLGQQGGQILQLFPRVGAAVFGALSSGPAIAFGAILAGIVVTLKDAYDRAERIRQLGGLLALDADGGLNTAAGLNAAAEALDQYGLSAENALKVVRVLMKDGFDESQIVELGKAAQDLADILGIDVADAAKQVGDAFSGGWDAVKKLDDATNVYTASQREQIQALYEVGRAEEARSLARDIATRKLDEVADKANGPWTRAARNLESAWDKALAGLSNSQPVRALGELFDTLAEKVDGLASSLQNLSAKDVFDLLTFAVNPSLIGTAIGNRIGGAINGGNGAPAFPNSLTRGRATNIDPATFRQSSGSASPVMTEAQKKAAQDIADAIERQAVAAGKVTSEAVIQNKLAAKRKELELEAAERFPRATAGDRADFVNAGVTQERLRLEEQLTQYKKQQADAAERAQKAAMAFPAQAMSLLKQFEGFQSTAKWDRNALRLGFGSSTITNPDGSFRKVVAGDTVTREGATRDLERRIQEFTNVVKQQIGGERFAQFSPSQQAALTSIAYNYGSLPDRIIGAVKAGTNEQIASAVRGLAGDNKGINARRRNLEADMLGSPNLAVDQGAAQVAADLQAKQDAFNRSLREEAAARQRNIDAANAQRGLSGEALIDAQREAEVQKAIADAREKAGKDGLKFSEEQAAAIRQQVELEYEAVKGIEARAKAARDAVDNPVNDLTAQRNALQSQITFQREQGNGGAADALLPQLDSVNARLQEAIGNAIAFYQALDPANNNLGLTADQIATIVSGLQMAEQSTQRWVSVLGVTGQQIAETFKNTATGALDRFAQALAEGKNAFTSLKNAFLDFAANFLRQMAQMIQQQLILNLISGLVRAGTGSAAGGGLGGSANGFGAVGGMQAHDGGIIGGAGPIPRAVNPDWFSRAARYHNGGIAGLRPDEVPAILQKGEEVLTASDPRHRANGGFGSDGQSIKIVNSFDPDEAAQAIMNTRSGEKAMLNFVTRNRRAFQDALSR